MKTYNVTAVFSVGGCAVQLGKFKALTSTHAILQAAKWLACIRENALSISAIEV